MADGPRDALVSRNSATTKHTFENQRPGPIVWHYLRDPMFSRFHTIPECDRHTHTHTDRQTDKETDTQRRHILRLAQRRTVKILRTLQKTLINSVTEQIQNASIDQVYLTFLVITPDDVQAFAKPVGVFTARCYFSYNRISNFICLATSLVCHANHT